MMKRLSRPCHPSSKRAASKPDQASTSTVAYPRGANQKGRVDLDDLLGTFLSNGGFLTASDEQLREERRQQDLLEMQMREAETLRKKNLEKRKRERRQEMEKRRREQEDREIARMEKLQEDEVGMYNYTVNREI